MRELSRSRPQSTFEVAAHRPSRFSAFDMPHSIIEVLPPPQATAIAPPAMPARPSTATYSREHMVRVMEPQQAGVPRQWAVWLMQMVEGLKRLGRSILSG